MNKFQKILTIEDLVNFCMENKMHNFSAKETGYQLSVQVPAYFNENTVEEDETMLYAFVRLFHIGRNRNGSSVTREAAEKSLNGIKYKPILANFTTNTPDGLEDFTSHDMEFDDDGNVIYLEHQVGCFTADQPYIAYDEETEKDFVFARIAIPREYSSSASIIERKNGTKISVELLINDMAFNANDKILELSDIVVQGATLLGTNPNTGKPVQEGMAGAKVSLTDFSTENNSLFSHAEINEKLVDTLERLNTTLEGFNIKTIFEKGGNEGMTKLEELLEKYGKTQEDLDFETEGLSDEELEAKFAEVFGEAEGNPVPEDGGEEGSEDDFATCKSKKKKKCSEDEDAETEEDLEDEEESEPNEEDLACKPKKKKRCSVEAFDKTYTYEVSLDEKIYALENLVNSQYSEQDNAYYYVKAYDDYVVMINYWEGNAYKQSYKADGETYSLVGDRVAVYANWLTKDEEDALASMRSNYSAMEDKLNKYVKAELDSQKEAIFEDVSYAKYLETEEFKSLINDKDNYSVEELKDKAEIAFAKCVKRDGAFTVTEEPTVKTVRHAFSKANLKDKKNKKPYGNIFSKD